MIPPELTADIDLLCLDAGNTVVFLDHARLARLLAEHAGVDVRPSSLVRAEGDAKRLAETGGLVDVAWARRDRPGARAWGKMVATILVQAGLPAARAVALLEHAWREHERRNLWCEVPEGLGEALDAARATGAKVAIVSNSEGMLERLFTELGILRHFDAVIDSGIVGVDKPDPRVFGLAMERFAVPPARTLHLGDVFATDILGARAAGIRCALIDPFGHYEGRHPDVPRVPGAAEVARALARARSRPEDTPRRRRSSARWPS